MTELLVKNAKISNSNNDQYTVYNFGIPAFMSKAGLKTCPMAGTCAKGCYATQGAYAWTNVQAAYEWRLKQTFRSDFEIEMDKAIKVKLKTAQRQGKTLVIRIHDSGDFYGLDYIQKWFNIMKRNPTVKFYAYTKMIPLFKRLELPVNFTLIYSEGGIADSKINPEIDRHARVFKSLDDLLSAGYANATENDLVAIGENKKIGLVYHGAKSKTWATSAV